MKPLKSKANPGSLSEIATLRSRLAEAEETLLALRNGDVDTVIVKGKEGAQIFTLEGADHPYRVLIESMKGGALTLSAQATILYANQCFASMIKRPLDQVVGSSFLDLLDHEEQSSLKLFLKRKSKTGSSILSFLLADNDTKVPVQIALRPLEKQTFNQAIIGVVITDLTQARKSEELLRALTHQVVQAQESERRRVAGELHDGITQLLCAMLFHSYALISALPSDNNKTALAAAIKLNDMAARSLEEVERIARDLRPSVLENLGIIAALRETCDEFSKRTGVSIKLNCVELENRLPLDTELALYRILQESLRNIEKHSKATSVKVCLSRRGEFIRMVIQDNGIGFDPDMLPQRTTRGQGLGLLSMRERATHLGGTVKLKSVLGSGTEIDMRVPLRTEMI